MSRASVSVFVSSERPGYDGVSGLCPERAERFHADPGPSSAFRDAGNARRICRPVVAGLKRLLRSRAPYLNLLGLGGFVLLWHVLTEMLDLPLFSKLPGPAATFAEWFSPDPLYGISLYTPEYYQHIGISIRRVFLA
ncbi:MAG: hypothetical protein LBC14_06335, partial [Desulfovibrio sp.]|nr:hypothetical protein [Desulfovibrio sp.]